MKGAIADFKKAGLKPSTIHKLVGIARLVIQSLIDEHGNLVEARTWNYAFMDMPTVKPSEQNRPRFGSEVVSYLATWGYLRERMIFILCAATGLRIGEALGLEIDKHVLNGCSLLKIEQEVFNCKKLPRVKSESSKREVDLHPDISECLSAFIGDRKDGFLFVTRHGKPLSLSSTLSRHLHPALLSCGYVNKCTGTHKAGTHAFRRFRNTYLRNKARCPEGLIKYWLGHSLAGGDMTDHYDTVEGELLLRHEWAEKAGYGFTLPKPVPMIPSPSGNRESSDDGKAPEIEDERSLDASA